MKNKKIYIIPIMIIFIDQIFKLIIINKKISIIPNFLDISYTKNTGGAFSILNNNIFILIIFSILIIALIFKFLKERIQQLNLNQIISLFIILGGAVGNLIDRVFRGYVIDYIKFNLFDFPTFNIADICIVIGIFFIGFDMITNTFKKSK